MLVRIKKVAPPFAVTYSFNQGNRPTSKILDVGTTLPPFSARFTELNIPPITKKNRNTFTIDLLRGLRISLGLTARSVILTPYRNPIAAAGKNMILIKIGDSRLIASI
ncbi:hypothetical protein BG20_I1752 [Candidatus Nitrosarchaeum limnium BG20]|uniref:Uncharacterized protein n=1 Tax=Candidatus Nitrosarchaeum limnium BG20 TaxID=859192 RepID=S2E5B0_9ARCH|nr:hypothetical protein BG20_I1752 [Candidatus Nitrosarchaeum limnium BG20]